MTGDWDRRLLQYLRAAWALPSLELIRPPRRVTGRYGRRSWLLELASAAWPVRRRLQFRCAGSGRVGLGPEVRRLQWLAARGFPVSPVVLWVEDVSVLGEPFALLEW